MLAPASASPAAAFSIVTPIIVKKPLGVGSKVMVVIHGIVGEISRTALMARVASARSVMVSTQMMSAPASISALICREKLSYTASGSVSP